MSSKHFQKPSPQTQEEALKIARSIQRPAQTKEQTKLIAQGIQKGIDQYKKQQKEKARELSRRHKKAAAAPEKNRGEDAPQIETLLIYRQHWLPWLLLALTWAGIGAYALSR